MKKFLLVFALFLVVLSAAAAPANDKIVVRVAHTIAPDSHYQMGLEHFGKLLDEASGGKIQLEIFHSSQLGSERDAIEGVAMGTLEDRKSVV